MIYFGRMIKMEKTWIANLLPQDEYREKRLLYFIAEAVFILGVSLFLYLMVESFIVGMDMPGDRMALLCIGFLITYTTLRSTLTGIEYPDVASEKRYQKEKRLKIYSTIHFWIIFLFISILFKGIPSNLEETFDIVGSATFAAIFFFILNYLSLKKSYKKNKDLLDD